MRLQAKEIQTKLTPTQYAADIFILIIDGAIMYYVKNKQNQLK